MSENLVIVESPAKAKTIEGFLGKDFIVTSSYGHIRDLEKKNSGIDIENKFKPTYIIPDEKKKVVSELKKMVKKSKVVWLATDEDREGEAISWHLKEALGLKDENIRRIVFNEITKNAILHAVENPRIIDINIVNAQQARRILDRLVGFELSPVLWRKVKPSLSAGRVQSVAVRLIVDREREIENFKVENFFRVIADFIVVDKDGKKWKLKAELPKRFANIKDAKEFLKICQTSTFNIESLEKKAVSKSPSAPFTTSTLQQEASRKLGFSVLKTMMVAQKLYEAGKISYMRTDSVNMSEESLSNAENVISESFGKNYSQTRKYKTKSASAQEAHEAIRPSYFQNPTVSGTADEQKLYELIWKRAIASQMSDAQIERTIVKVSISKSSEKFTAKGEVIKFDGFLKVYLESSEDENKDNDDSTLLPPLYEGEKLEYEKITATESFTRPSARYSEASLVKKLEELGIGRPSTYAPTISTIQKRGYVNKDEREGKKRNFQVLSIEPQKEIVVEEKSEITGADKGKLFPTDIAMLVNDFLMQNFPDIMNFQFTAHFEEELDDIASGKMEWTDMLNEFYFPFHEKVEHTTENADRVSGERILGTDPVSGHQVSVRMAKFGPVAQITDLNDAEAKPIYAGLRATQKMAQISLEDALELFKLPRTIGEFEDKEVVAAIGRFGPYIRHDSNFFSLNKNYDPYTIEISEAIEVIKVKREKDIDNTLKSFPEDSELKIVIGRWRRPYLRAGKKNIPLEKDVNIEELTYEKVKEMVTAFNVKSKKKK
ncbi:MAG: type I DNA topoisomerase [Bacteroidetes bacterium]|nr:type I DNA topoisomerase [Bacteroidota bacterium]MBU1113575.1 type I DNA topoisomerase [Bacteroidota bacterium]MBU1798623.1 type I DNA topoisomerase [Bacteroidota bacterium]